MTCRNGQAAVPPNWPTTRGIDTEIDSALMPNARSLCTQWRLGGAECEVMEEMPPFGKTPSTLALRNRVTVHALGRSEGHGERWKWAATASVR
jgi:hypothetical protein